MSCSSVPGAGAHVLCYTSIPESHDTESLLVLLRPTGST